MIEDVYEPLAKYRDEFKSKFDKLARETIQKLTAESGIDIPANRRQVVEVERAQEVAASLGWKVTVLWVLVVIGAIAAVAGVVMACNENGGGDLARWLWCAGGGVVGLAVFVPLLCKLSARLKEVKARIKEMIAVAWKQMEPLNRLYTWDIPVRLIQATVPRLEFDPYFTAERLAMLRERYGWDDSFNDGRSMLFAQSGMINGNPFVFAHYLEMEWGTETYHGTKTISWTEWVRDADGKRRSVRRYETLHASVTKPKPFHNEHKLLIYGNDAAPELSFSRQPSGLDGDDKALFSNLKKKWRLNRLEAYSRNLTDDSDFQLMSNHEFETWFHAKDRDNEVQFRMLFTPVAQTQMLALLKDKTVGYGDDFIFLKTRKINALTSKHLDKGVIDTNPKQFRDWNYDKAFENFINFNNRYFKDIYFSMAPLLAIPLYQQTRTHEDIWADVLKRRPVSAFWEHEAIANFHGEAAFRHPSCITRNILKTREFRRTDGECSVVVTAHGFRGVERVEHVSVYGGDGKWHDVPVRWTEYLPVSRDRELLLSERAELAADFRSKWEQGHGSAFRREIHSCLG